MMHNPHRLSEFVNATWHKEILPSLMQYIKIPNKSPHFDANWQQNGYMEQAVKHIAGWCEQHAPEGMHMEIVRLEGRTPLIFMEIPGTKDETILLYGHLDKQPEMEGWSEGLSPFEPVLRDGRLYGRGGADDGYSAYASLTAIKALQDQNLPHARCVLLIEACEESGSFDLPYYMAHLQDRIGEPALVICLDSGAGNYEQLWVTTSLRGNIVAELTVEVIKEGVHSGAASGIVADSFRIARQLLSRMEDENTGEIKLSEMYTDIPQERVQQAEHCARILKDKVSASFPFHEGAGAMSDDVRELLLNRTWRPCLTVTGADGLPAIANAGNVMRPKTALKLSLRLPPQVNPARAAKAMQQVLTDNPPNGAKISFKLDDAAMGWNAPAMAPWLAQACEQASQLFYDKPSAYIGEGGTIPFMGMLGQQFPNAQFLITGVLGPNSNAHGPNEFLHLDMVQKLTAAVAHVIYCHAQQLP